MTDSHVRLLTNSRFEIFLLIHASPIREPKDLDNKCRYIINAKTNIVPLEYPLVDLEY